MTRKDSEKDAERPHYYSQFWLDIAAGRRVIGGPRPEEAEASEVEAPEPPPTRKAGRTSVSATDGYKETRASVVIEPAVEEEVFEQEDMVDETEVPNIALDEYIEEAEEPVEEEDIELEAEEPEDEEFFDEEEEEEDEEEWGRRGARKKAKPVKPVKPVKKPKREPRRGF